MKPTIGNNLIKDALISSFVFFVLSGVPAFAGPVFGAEQQPVLTLELTIIHGKTSTPKEKREKSKAQIDVRLDDKETRIGLAEKGAYSSNSQNGISTDFIRNSTPEFAVSGRPVPGGAELRVSAGYRVRMPVPKALTTEGVANQTAIRGFEVDTSVALAASVGASVEVGSIEDPVADRAWSATVTIAGVKGAVPPGAVSKNKTYTAKIDEGGGSTLRKTTLSVSGFNLDSLRVMDAISVPYATTTLARTYVDFINYPVELNLRGDAKGSGMPQARVAIARQRGTEPGGEVWQVFETERNALPASGSALDMGSLVDGGLAMHAVLEMSE